MQEKSVFEIIKLVWPLIVLQYALAIWAIFDISKKKKTKNLSPVIWILICLFVNIVGSILYLLIGRTEE